ncbi:hypothetical protein B0T13DRAFT_482096 [Neurospora crassa]|nr:hypothetical protein B0T13DRAFT_482096 [Neurospora crassa]
MQPKIRLCTAVLLIRAYIQCAVVAPSALKRTLIDNMQNPAQYPDWSYRMCLRASDDLFSPDIGLCGRSSNKVYHASECPSRRLCARSRARTQNSRNGGTDRSCHLQAFGQALGSGGTADGPDSSRSHDER